MRRQNSNLNEDVILFLGQCEIITLNPTQQIALATRTLLLKEDVLLTYQSPISSVRQSRLSRTKAPIPLDKLTNHQHQYRITAAMRARLLLGRRDDGVAAYLKELRVDKADQGSNIVAVVNQQERIMHGFLFREEATALDFFQSLNVAIGTQLYIQKLPESLSFNPKIVDLLGETLNGRCCIAPQDFADGRQEQDEIRFVVDFLRGLQGQPGVNFRGGLNELQLRFRVVDDTSRDYALRFLQVFPEKVERLVMAGCEINSNMLAHLISAPSTPLADRFLRLQEINMTKGALTDDAFATLGKLLKSCRRLGTLNLGDNSVSFEKEAIIVGFLCSIVHLRLTLLLPNNKIASAKHITKYLLNAEGPLPLTHLDISYNPVPPEELSLLTKAYLGKLKQEGFDFRLQLTQLQFQEPQAFQFLQEEYRLRKPNSLAIPVAITKHILRKKGKEVGNTEEDLQKASKIEDLFREYGIQVFRGNFYRLKQIRRELPQLGVTDDVIDTQVQKFIPQKHIQEQMILRKMQSCLNLDLHPRQSVCQLNETLRFCRRKGLSGTAFDLLACIKHRMEELIMKQAENGELGRAYREGLYTRKGRYKAFYEQFFREDYVFHINLPGLLQMTDQQLLKEQMGPSRPENITAFMTYQYLLSDHQKPHLFLLETCLADPRLSSLKIARFQRYNVVQIYQKARVGKTFLPIPVLLQQRTAFLNTYSIQTYRFSDSFIQSGVSSSAYAGMLSRGTVQAEQQRQVLAFIQISKNFLKYLYYTPQQLSEQTLIYLSSITAHLSNLQNAHQDPLKLLLAEELLIHFMTFFDSTRYQPLKPSLLSSIAEFIARRVALPLDLLKRLGAFVIRSEGGAEGELRLHCAQGGQPWEGKVDWRPADLHVLGGLVLSRGRVQVRVADAAHPELVVGLEVDELATGLDLWCEVKSQVEKLNQVTNISQENVDYYWLFTGRVEGEPLRPLTSFEHVGKLFCQQGADCFYLRRVLFRPEQHSLDYLSKMKYEQLLAIYQQGRESFRLAAGLMLSPEATLQAIMLAMWTDVLLADELMLGDLRRREDPQSQARYGLQRERIVGECLSRLYSRYVPVGFSLEETSRNKVIFDIKSRQMGAVPKNYNQAIKTTILSFLRRVGVAAFTTVLPSSAAPCFLYLNNQQVIFVDRSLPQPKILRAFFRNIMQFDLTAEGDSPILRFSVAEPQVELMGVHRFSIQGDSIWIGQCFIMICQVARNRLSYPPDLLFACEDEVIGLSDCPIKTRVQPLLSFPILALETYFSLTLPRQEVPRVAIVPPPPSAPGSVPSVGMQPNDAANQPGQQQPPQQNEEIMQKLSVPDPQGRQASKKQGPPANSLGVIPERDPELQQIVKSAGQIDVVTSRRSSNKSKDAHRRKSRNR